MVDLILVEQRLEMMSDFLGSLGDLTSIPRSEFLRDPLRIAAAESYLTRSLMGLFDVGRYLLPGSDQSDPDEEYKSIARGLANRGFIDQRLGDVLVEMAGYRNRMVHMYYDVTAEEMYTIISDHMGDIEEFVRQIRTYLKSH